MRLLKRVEYEAVYGAGQRRSSPQFSVFFRAQTPLPKEAAGREAPHEGSSVKAPVAGRTSRFGISVKKALGGAVVRNRIKRRVREILRRNRMEIPSGWDIVIHPKSTVARAAFAPLEAELVRLLRSIQNAGQNTGRNSSPNSTPKAAPNPTPRA
jgi:ribonuclease P protein component